MAQTPQQKRANEKFARDQQARMGQSKEQLKKLTKETPKSKPQVSKFWLGVLAFIIFGGIVFELVAKMLGR